MQQEKKAKRLNQEIKINITKQRQTDKLHLQVRYPANTIHIFSQIITKFHPEETNRKYKHKRNVHLKNINVLKDKKKVEERRNFLNWLKHVLFSGSIIDTGDINMNKTKAFYQGENIIVYSKYSSETHNYETNTKVINILITQETKSRLNFYLSQLNYIASI